MVSHFHVPKHHSHEPVHRYIANLVSALAEAQFLSHIPLRQLRAKRRPMGFVGLAPHEDVDGVQHEIIPDLKLPARRQQTQTLATTTTTFRRSSLSHTRTLSHTFLPSHPSCARLLHFPYYAADFGPFVRRRSVGHKFFRLCAPDIWDLLQLAFAPSTVALAQTSPRFSRVPTTWTGAPRRPKKSPVAPALGRPLRLPLHSNRLINETTFFLARFSRLVSPPRAPRLTGDQF